MGRKFDRQLVNLENVHAYAKQYGGNDAIFVTQECGGFEKLLAILTPIGPNQRDLWVCKGYEVK